MNAVALLFIMLLSATASAAERWAVPDPLVTPGAVNPAVSIEALCSHVASEQNVPTLPPWVTDIELSSYDIPASDKANYVMNYLIPLSLGGANTISNVWPQPRTEVEKKAALETKLQLRVCAASAKLRPEDAAQVLANAQRFLEEDWTAAYAVYVEH